MGRKKSSKGLLLKDKSCHAITSHYRVSSPPSQPSLTQCVTRSDAPSTSNPVFSYPGAFYELLDEQFFAKLNAAMRPISPMFAESEFPTLLESLDLCPEPESTAVQHPGSPVGEDKPLDIPKKPEYPIEDIPEQEGEKFNQEEKGVKWKLTSISPPTPPSMPLPLQLPAYAYLDPRLRDRLETESQPMSTDILQTDSSLSATAGATTSAAPVSPQKSIVKPKPCFPPLIVEHLPEWTRHFRKITTILGHRPNARPDGRGIRFDPGSEKEHRRLRRYFTRLEKEEDVVWFSNSIPAENSVKVAIKGLPVDTPTMEIIEELQSLGFKPKYVRQIQVRHGHPRSIYFVQLCHTANIPCIFKIEELLCMPGVKIEAWREKPEPAPCHHCQLACVRCGGVHRAEDCPQPLEDQPTCANCKGPYTLDNPECPACRREAQTCVAMRTNEAKILDSQLHTTTEETNACANTKMPFSSQIPIAAAVLPSLQEDVPMPRQSNREIKVEVLERGPMSMQIPMPLQSEEGAQMVLPERETISLQTPVPLQSEEGVPKLSEKEMIHLPTPLSLQSEEGVQMELPEKEAIPMQTLMPLQSEEGVEELSERVAVPLQAPIAVAAPPSPREEASMPSKSAEKETVPSPSLSPFSILPQYLINKEKRLSPIEVAIEVIKNILEALRDGRDPIPIIIIGITAIVQLRSEAPVAERPDRASVTSRTCDATSDDALLEGCRALARSNVIDRSAHSGKQETL